MCTTVLTKYTDFVWNIYLISRHPGDARECLPGDVEKCATPTLGMTAIIVFAKRRLPAFNIFIAKFCFVKFNCRFTVRAVISDGKTNRVFLYFTGDSQKCFVKGLLNSKLPK